MYETMISRTHEQFNKLTAPVQKFNALVFGHLEKFAQFHLEAAKSYSDLGLEQLRAALSISDTDSLNRYVVQQNKVAVVVGKKFSSDTETLVSLSKGFTTDVQKFANDNVVALAPLIAAKANEPKKTVTRKSA